MLLRLLVLAAVVCTCTCTLDVAADGGDDGFVARDSCRWNMEYDELMKMGREVSVVCSLCVFRVEARTSFLSCSSSVCADSCRRKESCLALQRRVISTEYIIISAFPCNSILTRSTRRALSAS
jgi:hypothetical protein